LGLFKGHIRVRCAVEDLLGSIVDVHREATRGRCPKIEGSRAATP